MKYYSSWSDTILISAILLAMALFGYFEYGLTESFLEGTVLMPIVIIILLYGRLSTRIEINERTLSNFGFRNFGHDEMDIFSIRYIGRAQSLPWKSGGSLMIFYGLNKNDEIIQTSLRERAYNSDTLLDILRSVKKINPHIMFDETYKEFLEVDNEEKLNQINPRMKVREADAKAAEIILVK